MTGAELKKAKKRVRSQVKSLRDELSPKERDRIGLVIVERLLGLPELAQARIVMAFWSFGSEVPTAPLLDRLHARGVRIALPRIARGEIEACTYFPGDPVTIAPFGAGEPSDGVVLAPTDVDVIVTPGVAFDRRGRRVGYGGGFYDRFLARTRPDALRAAICYGVQLVVEPLPAGSFDLPVDVLVTESEILRFSR
ncbi:MAG: 5-formyltetrahydrofolate cyclo-ligase [Actinobacteria bacterium]|nr:5-formyltetrahydrofolate cyclo-ligase [Actinomycetota bacterium]